MTIKNRTFISPDDILAVEYECPDCHTRYLTPLKKFEHVVTKCRACSKEIISETHRDSGKSTDEVAVHDFLNALKELQVRKLTASLRLEIPDVVFTASSKQ